MDKGVSRSQPGLEPHAQSCIRKQRKTVKKCQQVVCNPRDGTGRAAHGPHQDQAFALFNNRSLSMLSTMHHLNPHRKIAMSPELLRDAEEQASSLRKANKQLQDQLDKTTREKARIHRFLSDLLYTLNARGYESVRDHEGTVVDLNKCKGESYLDLKGRDLKQRINVRRPGGQEFLLKAVIGNQERAVQSLVYKLDSIGRDIVLSNRLTSDDPGILSAQDSEKISSLEAEVFQLVTLIEGACQKSPDIYPALRDHYYLCEGSDGADTSPRYPVIQNLLKKCEQISRETQNRQLIELLNNDNNRLKHNSQTTNKQKITKSITKPRAINKSPRAVSSDIVGSGPANARQLYDASECAHLYGPPRSALMTSRAPAGGVEGLKRLNGVSKSENSIHSNSRESQGPFLIKSSSQGPSAVTINSSSGEPVPAFYSTKSSPDQSLENNSVTVCPYCSRRFGIEESIAEIKNHIEMHIFAGDSTLVQ